MRKTEEDWKCLECGEREPCRPYRQCTCPTMIYIPPGQHIHVDCPVHGKNHRINGGSKVWC